jgi:hypothetical protein
MLAMQETVQVKEAPVGPLIEAQQSFRCREINSESRMRYYIIYSHWDKIIVSFRMESVCHQLVGQAPQGMMPYL